MADSPGEKLGKRDEALVDGRRRCLFDGLLVGFPIAHVAGDNGNGIEAAAVSGAAPLGEMGKAAAVGSERVLGSALVMKLSEPLVDEWMRGKIIMLRHFGSLTALSDPCMMPYFAQRRNIMGLIESIARIYISFRLLPSTNFGQYLPGCFQPNS